jgi:general secretion pathway protein G
MGSSIKAYRFHTGQLPPSEKGLQALVDRPDSLPPGQNWTKIADHIPKDPWGKEYCYVAGDGLPECFGFYSCGPDGVSASQGNDPDDRNSWSEDGRGIQTGWEPLKPWLGLSGAGIASVFFFFGRWTPRGHRTRKTAPDPAIAQ